MPEPKWTEKRQEEFATDEERQDYLDACAAADAVTEALASLEIRPFDEFLRELES